MPPETDFKKLQALLQHAREHCPYYSFLPPLERATDQAVEEYFQRIPILSRHIVQSQTTRLWSSTGDRIGWRKTQTSGRSGEPVEVVLSQESQAVEAVLFSMHMDRVLGTTDWRRGRTYYLTLHVGATSRTIRSLWHDQGQLVKWNLVRLWQESDRDFFEALKVVQDCIVNMMPSVAELLCLRLQASGVAETPRPRLVLLSGEMVSAELKSLITATMKCPVTSLYTMAEVGIIASEHSDEPTYQVEEKSVIVEILDEKGERVPDGQEGDIIVTPLNNLAMPLIRYRSGDRGVWIRSNASPPVFRLVDARTPKYLTTSDGRSINAVRFAKILASLNLGYYNIEQTSDGSIVFSYSTRSQNLDEDSSTLIKTLIRSALGPDTVIQIRKVANPETSKTTSSDGVSDLNQPGSEPLGPDLLTLADWLRQRLQGIPDIRTAVLTGSSLDQKATTRFSDIDLVMMVERNPDDMRWIELGWELKSHIPRLSINFDTLSEFTTRSPLLACRLLSEQIPLIGSLDESVLPRPSAEAICLNGLYWTQETIATISHRLLDTAKPQDRDPIFETWLTAKWIINVLRYKYLLSGETNMAIKAIMGRLRTDPQIPDQWKTELSKVVYISREAIPPPFFDQGEFELCSKLAISYIRLVQDNLMQMYANLELQ